MQLDRQRVMCNYFNHSSRSRGPFIGRGVRCVRHESDVPLWQLDT